MTDPQPSKTEKIKAEVKKEINKIPSTTDNNLLAAVSYVWLLSIVMLIIKKDDEFIQFHAKQGVILLIATALAFIPGIGWLVWFFAVVGMVVGFMHAWQG